VIANYVAGAQHRRGAALAHDGQLMGIVVGMAVSAAVLCLLAGAVFAVAPERVMRANLRVGARARDSSRPEAYRRLGYLMLVGPVVCAFVAIKIALLN
jgi:uncharacterized membrane protein YedE/YeeE